MNGAGRFNGNMMDADKNQYTLAWVHSKKTVFLKAKATFLRQ